MYLALCGKTSENMFQHVQLSDIERSRSDSSTKTDSSTKASTTKARQLKKLDSSTKVRQPKSWIHQPKMEVETVCYQPPHPFLLNPAFLVAEAMVVESVSLVVEAGALVVEP